MIKGVKPNLNAHIENISKTKFYSGSDIMIFVLQILYRLNIKSCSLKDSLYIDCEIPLKIVKLLQKGNTFYGLFGWITMKISKIMKMTIPKRAILMS